MHLNNEPLPITDTTITLEFRKVGKTTYEIPEHASAEEKHFWTLMNEDAGGWDAMIDELIAKGADDETAFLTVVGSDSILKEAFKSAFPNGLDGHFLEE